MRHREFNITLERVASLPSTMTGYRTYVLESHAVTSTRQWHAYVEVFCVLNESDYHPQVYVQHQGMQISYV